MAEESGPRPDLSQESTTYERPVKYYYGYNDRDHSGEENLKHLGIIYGATWVVYPLTQPKVFREKGSWDNYKHNFGRIVFDQDEPFWNWFVHPLSGSQLYLYYRANGYRSIESLAMAFISSALFEFTAEIYTEPASVQDLYQTPLLGSVLGLGFENLSMYLLNTNNYVGKFFGHLINPATLFWFYEGKVRVTPDFDGKRAGLWLTVDY